ncbi:MAG TPA: glutaredoxin 3 [Xanthomonadales bacterium]|nr:glutaredoxin 3 [Xanthomonadales bacterium]
MPKIEIYTTAICPYCVAAKNFLVQKGASYEEVRVDRDRERFAEMLTRSNNRRTVPQIFIGGTHVGGFDDMVALDRAGGLEPLLRG